jgi:predicted nucleic acid-binding protein
MTVGAEVLATADILTSDLVIVEVLNYLNGRDIEIRQNAFNIVSDLHTNSLVEVVPYTRTLFEKAGALYLQAKDKRWSFTDCSSFVIMRERNIRDALTADEHFEQAGFRALLRK